MQKLITFASLAIAIAIVGCSTDNNKQSQAIGKSKSDSTAAALEERHRLQNQAVAYLDSIDGTKTPPIESEDNEGAATETTSSDEASMFDAMVGTYALQRNKNSNKPAVKIEKEYEDYYLSLMGDQGQWFPRRRLRDMNVDEVENKFGKSAEHFLEIAMISENGTPIYKVIKGKTYNGKVFETEYVLDLITMQQLRKIK